MTVKKEEIKEITETAEKKEMEAEKKIVEKKAVETKEKEPKKTEDIQLVKEEPKKERKEKSPSDDDTGGKQTLLVETEKYLNTGAHIGTKFKSGDMKKYIYKVRKDGLNVLDVQTLDDRLKMAAKFIAQIPKEKVVVVSRKVYGQTPAAVFSDIIGAKILTGRFVPGTFTNPQGSRFVEPGVVLVTEPESDTQAIDEATRVRVPVVALVSTNNSLKNIDIAVPINNKGRKSLALGFWILAKEILKERGEIKTDAELSKTPEDFEYKMKEGDEEKGGEKKSRWDKKRPAFPRRKRF